MNRSRNRNRNSPDQVILRVDQQVLSAGRGLEIYLRWLWKPPASLGTDSSVVVETPCLPGYRQLCGCGNTLPPYRQLCSCHGPASVQVALQLSWSCLGAALAAVLLSQWNRYWVHQGFIFGVVADGRSLSRYGRQGSAHSVQDDPASVSLHASLGLQQPRPAREFAPNQESLR